MKAKAVREARGQSKKEAALRTFFSHTMPMLAELRGCKTTLEIFALSNFLTARAQKGRDFEVWPVEETNVWPPRPHMHFNPERVERLFANDAAQRLKGTIEPLILTDEEDTAHELAGLQKLAGRL